jgi:hypothetical protein
MANRRIVRKWILVGLFCVGFPIGLFFSRHGRTAPARTAIDVDFNSATNFDMDQMNGTIDSIPQRARDLDGKRVRIVGEMWAPKARFGNQLSEFQLADLTGRQIGGPEGPPLAQHFIDCVVNPGAQIFYHEDRVAVHGIWHVDIQHDASGGIKQVFRIDVDAVEPENKPDPSNPGGQ